MELPQDGTDIWCVDLRRLGDIGPYLAALEPPERRRAASYLGLEAMRHAVVGRGMLRLLLAAYLGRTPQQVPLTRDSHGRPRLTGARELDFNLTHSGDCLVLACRRGGKVGVDVERVRTDLSYHSIAEQSFAAAEREALLRAEAMGGGTALFFRYWTRKEAVLKAVGTGLLRDLAAVDVSSAPALAAGLKGLANASGPCLAPLAFARGDWRGAGWRLMDFDPQDGYCSALVILGPSGRLRFFRWPADPVPNYSLGGAQ